MRPADDPYIAADRVLAAIGDLARIVIVDMHAEATADKYLMANYLNGRVAAVGEALAGERGLGVRAQRPSPLGSVPLPRSDLPIDDPGGALELDELVRALGVTQDEEPLVGCVVEECLQHSGDDPPARGRRPLIVGCRDVHGPSVRGRRDRPVSLGRRIVRPDEPDGRRHGGTPTWTSRSWPTAPRPRRSPATAPCARPGARRGAAGPAERRAPWVTTTTSSPRGSRSDCSSAGGQAVAQLGDLRRRRGARTRADASSAQRSSSSAPRSPCTSGMSRCR